jgi:hypothetical protein
MKAFIVGLLAVPFFPIYAVGMLMWVFIRTIQHLGEDILEGIKGYKK